jgi:hypothetical protein
MITILKELRTLFLWSLLLVVAWSSIFAAKAVETSFFPVVKDVEITSAIPSSYKSGISVYLKFTKVRSCEFLKVLWYDKGGNVVPVSFSTNVGTRPPSENEVGPWHVSIPELEGSTLYVQHQCHPLWTQFTKMYP